MALTKMASACRSTSETKSLKALLSILMLDKLADARIMKSPAFRAALNAVFRAGLSVLMGELSEKIFSGCLKNCSPN